MECSSTGKLATIASLSKVVVHMLYGVSVVVTTWMQLLSSVVKIIWAVSARVGGLTGIEADAVVGAGEMICSREGAGW
jgi:hypothetical protein